MHTTVSILTLEELDRGRELYKAIAPWRHGDSYSEWLAWEHWIDGERLLATIDELQAQLDSIKKAPRRVLIQSLGSEHS